MKFLFTLLITITFLTFNSIPSNAQKKDKRFGVYSAHLYEAEGIKNHTIDSENSIYEDSLIKIDWAYGNSQIEFDLTNKSGQTIKIMWDDAAYVSIANESGRVFHKGIKYTDRENSMPPTSIYKNTTISDLVAPTSYSRYVSGQYGGWRSDPLIPISLGVMSSKIEYREELLGKTMRVVLPIKTDDKVIEYIFSFKTEFLERKK